MPLIDSETAALLDDYRTAEFATLSRGGAPLVWPVFAHRRPDGTLLVTSSPAHARKALNVRRDGRVALLFSDPTGSGRTEAPQLLLTGTAHCPPEIAADPGGLEDYWTRVFARQPMIRQHAENPGGVLMDWYFTRLLITIVPETLTVREPLAREDVRAAAGAGPGPALLGADVLARFRTAVLGAVDPAGAPLLARTGVIAREDGFEIRAGTGPRVVAGPASLLVHRHDDQLSGLYEALVRGRLSALGGDRWLLTPERVVEPNGNGRASDAFRLLREHRQAAARYFERRGLSRPEVGWPEYRKLAAGSDGSK